MSRVLLSGASSGTGAQLFEMLSSRGYSVYTLGRTPVEGSVAHFFADFADPSSVLSSLADIDVSFDAFINCAGMVSAVPFYNLDPDLAQKVLSVNTISPLMACRALRCRFSSDAVIILFSSQSAFRGGWDDAYIASKGAINSLVKSLATKFSPNVRVIGIAPGVIQGTRMTLGRLSNDLDAIRSSLPLRRLLDPSELAELCISLMGPSGRHMTGSMIDINGGAYFR